MVKGFHNSSAAAIPIIQSVLDSSHVPDRLG